MEQREWGRDVPKEEEDLVTNSLTSERIGMTVSAKDVQLPFEGLKKKDLSQKEEIIKQFEKKLIREIDRAEIFDEHLDGLSIETVKTKLEKRAEQLNYQYNSKIASHDFYHLDAEDSEGELKELVIVNDFLGRIKMAKDPFFDFRTGGSDSREACAFPFGAELVIVDKILSAR